MVGFSKLLKVADECHLNSCHVMAAVRIKPLFEQEDSDLRAAAFRLLGDLADSLKAAKQSEGFKEQISGCLVTLLLHLCDDHSDVVKVLQAKANQTLYDSGIVICRRAGIR